MMVMLVVMLLACCGLCGFGHHVRHECYWLRIRGLLGDSSEVLHEAEAGLAGEVHDTAADGDEGQAGRTDELVEDGHGATCRLVHLPAPHSSLSASPPYSGE